MKCIECGVDSKLKERSDNLGRCKNCGHDFVFEPTIMTINRRVTDTFFANLIKIASANGGLHFTANQLYYLLNKRLISIDSKNDGVIGFFVALIIPVVFVASIDERSIAGVTISGLLGIFAIAVFLSRKQGKVKGLSKTLIDRVQFDRWLARWNSINNIPEKLLPIPQTVSLPAEPNPEVTAYSFDRVVVCDTPEIAQLLISNNFHFENNCAILTIDGYPHSIFSITMEMLRRNPDLKVYAFHNCSPSGIQLIHRLRADNNWFPNPEIPIIDVGILPRQIIDNLDVLTLRSTESAQASQQLSPALRNNLNPAELKWLDAGCYLELEYFSSQKLIRILQRSISESRELAAIEGDELESTSDRLFYTIDSFG